jgi:LysR family hydrogen peroxide-inducible transcriptional activator
MNIKDLKYLTAVAEHKNFRKAAEACFVSQPTLSMQLKKLEDFLQVQLIERNSRNIMLTPAGIEVCKRATEINQLTDEIINLAKNFRNPLAGDIKIGAFPTLAPYYFPKILPKISKNFPELNVYLFEDKTEKLTDMLKSGEIDAAFLALPIKNKQFEIRRIFSEQFYLAAPKSVQGGTMKFKREKVSLDDIKGMKLLLLEEGHCLRDQAMSVCKISGAGENKTFRATSLETLRNMVSNGMGMTLMPALAMQENDGINYIAFDKADNAKRDIALVWRKDSQRAELFENIASSIK